MLAFLLSTLLSLFLFIVFGFFTVRFLKANYGIVEIVLIGFVVSNTVSSYLSLLFPLSLYVLIFLITLCLILLPFIIKQLKKRLRVFRSNYIILYSLSFIFIAFLISLSPPEIYDAGLYHIQSIKWIEEFSVVPGLANLHGRFGFNPAIFTLFATTSLFPFFQQEIFSINFVIFSILVFNYINKSILIFKKEGFSNQFWFFLLMFLLILKLPHISSPSPDYISTAISFFIFSRMIELSGESVSSGFKKYIPILLLSIYLLTVKLALLPLLLLVIFISINHRPEYRKLLWLLPIFSIIVIPWLIRNVILSGWLIYPFPSLDLFNFDWQVPIENVISEMSSVKGWARIPYGNIFISSKMDFIEWFPIWWKELVITKKLLLMSGLVFPLLIFISHFINERKIKLMTLAIIFTSFSGVLFWFALAPDWRFGESFILIASMSPLLVLKSYRPSFKFHFISSTILIFFIGYSIIGEAFIVIAIITQLLYFKSYWAANKNVKIVYGVLLLLFLGNYIERNNGKIIIALNNVAQFEYILTPAKIEKPTNVEFWTYSLKGIEISVPTEGDRCFYQNIPCTPYYDSTLILRGTTLQSGFMHLDEKAK